MEKFLEIEREMSEIKSKQAAADEQHKNIFKQLDKQNQMIESFHALVRSVDRLTGQLAEMKGQVAGLRGDVEEIKNKPRKRWESIVEKVMFTVIGAVVMFMVNKLLGV